MKLRNRFSPNFECLEDRAVPSASSLFDSGLEGWKTVRDDGHGTGATALQWRSVGGTTNGYIQATDKQDGHAFYWQAPAKFHGDQLDTLGKFLTFEERVNLTSNQFSKADVILTGGGISLELDMPKNPGKTWTAYAAQLSADGGWTVSGTHRAPTAAEFATVLGSVSDLKIRGEFTSLKGTTRLDDVRLGDVAPTVSVNSVSRFEKNTGTTSFKFTVSLSHIMPTAATVHYVTSNGTATAGSDYTAVADTELTFTPGQTSKTITIKVKADHKAEANEMFQVSLSSPSANVTLGQDVGIGTILNDD